MTTPKVPARPRKMTYTEFNQAKKRLRRRLEDSLEEIPHTNGAERRFVGAMIDLLFGIRYRDRGAEEFIRGTSDLTRKGQLRDIFSTSTSEYTKHGLTVRVESPSSRI